jgi:hypothetical protein
MSAESSILMTRNFSKCFYARGGHWRFYTAKTQLRHRPAFHVAVPKSAFCPFRYYKLSRYDVVA